MAIEIPEDWPRRGWVEDTPLGHLETLATDAVSGLPTRWEVASWETTREMTSSALPGQVRAKTGLSVGTGKALVKREGNDYPWKKRAVYDLSGSDAQILLAPEGRAEIPTGQFKVAETNGDISTIGVQVDLDEKTIEGRDKSANVKGWSYDDVSESPSGTLPVDPSWWVSELARQLGYGVGLEPGADGYSPILDVPFQGSILPAYPRGVTYSGDEYTWAGMEPGIVALAQPYLSAFADAHYDLYQPITASVIITLDVRDTFRFRWDSNASLGHVEFLVTNRAGFSGMVYDGPAHNLIELTVDSRGTTGAGNTAVTSDFEYDQVTDRPEGIQVQFEVLSSDGINWTGARARVARGEFAPWSAWVTHTATVPFGVVAGDENNNYGAQLTAMPHAETGDTEELSMISRFTMVDTADTSSPGNTPGELWSNTSGENGRLYLEPLFGTITSPWLSPDLSTWGAMQEVVEAWMGALITDVYGDLRLLNRFSLVGVGTGIEMPIDVGLKFEDLPWVMNAADQADRLEVIYRPAIVSTVDPNVATKLPIIWEADQVIVTRPGGNDVFFDTEYLYLMYTAQIPWVQKNSPDFNEVYHTWDAYRYNNGTGAHMQPNSDVGIRIEQVTVSTWKVYIENRTSAPFHMVDSTGTPWLKVRSYYHMDQTREEVIERGLSNSDAKNSITIDLDNYVQNETDANALADFLWGRLNQRSWRADTVTMVPDYRVDLGDVVELTHSRTGILSNALVTKVHLDGEPGKVGQKVDLVLIPLTWEDFDEAWVEAFADPGDGNWIEFDALWAPYTWEDFDRAPTATTTAQIEEAL